VGTNNIDLAAAREQGVVVTNTPGVLTEATADLTWTLILAVTRRVIEGDAMMRRGEFTGWHPLMLRGASLQGKRLGIVGMGRIGSAVATRAGGFGMNVVHTPSRQHPGGIELSELLLTSDVVSLHAPLNEQTHHLINPMAMKGGAYLINTARGPLVEEKALADALERGHLAGAGLDVYEFEPDIEPRLVALPNVVLLPHLGSATTEARDEMARLAATGIIEFFRGHQPGNAVTA
jgi:glyoxylate reductase